MSPDTEFNFSILHEIEQLAYIEEAQQLLDSGYVAAVEGIGTLELAKALYSIQRKKKLLSPTSKDIIAP